MDPTANLNAQLLVARRIDTCPKEACATCAMDAARLAELVIALDEWIRAGGFLPAPWRRG